MAYGIFRKVTTLEFFQHHFAKSGHGDGLLMTRQLISTFRQPPLHYLTRSVRRTSGFVLADNPSGTSVIISQKPFSGEHSGSPTHRPNEAIILGSRCRAGVLPSPSRYRLMQ